jgi:hypothetical protein
MILFMWGLIFMVAVIPGAIAGWLVGKIPWCAEHCWLLDQPCWDLRPPR